MYFASSARGQNNGHFTMSNCVCVEKDMTSCNTGRVLSKFVGLAAKERIRDVNTHSDTFRYSNSDSSALGLPPLPCTVDSSRQSTSGRLAMSA